MKTMNKIIGGILIGLTILQPMSISALEKTETVYTNLDSYGNVSKSLVNNHLYIATSGEVEDDTELKKLLNINGKEKYVQNERMLTWASTGKDIFYTGTTDKEQPISIKATYYLNGEEMNINAMLGKEGKVDIVLDFTNHSYDEASGLYTPFVVTVGTMMNSSYINNISVTNGKVINNGKTDMVVAIASPGLYESLGISEFQSLNQIKISFDTTKFSLNEMYVVATPKLLEDMDLSVFDKMDVATSSIYTLQENMNQIEAGVKRLEQGSISLVDGASTLSNNLYTAFEATKKLESGSIAIDAGLKQMLSSFEEAQATLQNKDIAGSLANMQALKEQNTNTITVLNNTNASLEATYTTYNLGSMSEEELKTVLASQGLDSATITNLVTCKKTYEGNMGLVQLLGANNRAIDASLSALTEISTQITSMVTELNTALTTLETGESELSQGLTTLKTGMNQLYEGAVSLHSGANTLKEGISTVSVGVTALNEQGIHKLTAIAGSLNTYSYKAKQLVNLSKNYSGYSSNNATSSLFIYKMASVK